MLRDDSSVRKKTVALKTLKVSSATVKTTSSDGQEGVDSALAARVRRAHAVTGCPGEFQVRDDPVVGVGSHDLGDR